MIAVRRNSGSKILICDRLRIARFGTALPDLSREHGAKAVPPEPHRFMAEIDTALVQLVVDVPK